MKRVGIFEAKTHFSALIIEVVDGETVIVTKNGVPVATISPIGAEQPRAFGVAKALFDSGQIVVADDFDAPLPPEMIGKLHGV
ncbi:MAG: hypothetical protein NVS1B2_26400 [Vulcanimicrobiaceae bacterium]